MKLAKLAGPVAVWVAIAVGATIAEAGNPFDQKLPFANATISYVISGAEKGSETVYLVDYGRRSATYHNTVSKIMGMTVIHETIEIKDPDWIYSYDLGEHNGTKSRNPIAYMQEELEKLSPDDQQKVLANSRQFGLNMMAAMGGRLEENALEMLGYSCDRMNALGTEVYSIHGSGIPLRTESNLMGMKLTSVATAVDIGTVDGKYFQPPKGIEAVYTEEAETMSRQLARQTIEWLKNPEGGPAKQGLSTMGNAGGVTQGMQMDSAVLQQVEDMLRNPQAAQGN